jgi:hypothetical protein
MEEGRSLCEAALTDGLLQPNEDQYCFSTITHKKGQYYLVMRLRMPN